jgi:hypothetical protein
MVSRFCRLPLAPPLWLCVRCALLLAALGWSGLLVSPPPCAAQDKLQLLFSDNPKDAEPKEFLTLRPNVTQPVHIFVRNPTETTQEVTVELWAGESPLAPPQKVKAEANKLTRVSLGKPAAPGEKPAPLVAVNGAFEVRLRVDEKTPPVVEKLVMLAPGEYVKVTSISYDPSEQGGKKNRLTVRLRADRTLLGPRCRVELVLNPDRIPGFVRGQKKEGTYAGYLLRAGEELVLTAENLQFEDGSRPKSGLFYLTVDGYERAFTFSSDFPREGIASRPDQVRTQTLRLSAPRYGPPTAKFPVSVEIDNSKEGERGELDLIGLVPDEEGKLVRKASSLATFFSDRKSIYSDRELRLLFSAQEPNGGLRLKPELSDWSTDVDLSEVYGERTLRLRLLDRGRDPLEVVNTATGEKTTEVLVPVGLDATKPEGVKFVRWPKQLLRNAPIVVRATGRDPESDISRVIFFVGKPAPDGKVPADVISAEELPDPEYGKIWAAELPVSTEQKALFDVTVQFTNGAGLSATETIKIQLVDPPPPVKPDAKPPAGPKPAIIEGRVVEGGRPQPNVTVSMLDTKDLTAKGTATTDAQGKFVFKDVPAGSYRLSASKTAANTRGTTTVSVIEGQKKTDVEIKLNR